MMRPRVAIVLPDVGAAPVVLSAWFADPGDAVFEGDRLVEVLVGGATFDVSSPATGRLAEKRRGETSGCRRGRCWDSWRRKVKSFSGGSGRS